MIIAEFVGEMVGFKRSLAAVDRPTLIIAATADDLNYRNLEAAYIIEEPVAVVPHAGICAGAVG